MSTSGEAARIALAAGALGGLVVPADNANGVRISVVGRAVHPPAA